MTNNDKYHAQLLAAAESIQARESKLRAYLCDHPADAEAIVAANEPTELNEAQLQAVISFDLGLPLGTTYTAEQLELIKGS
jgi:hypothetical protein